MNLSQTNWNEIAYRGIFSVGNTLYIALQRAGRSQRGFSTVYVYMYQTENKTLYDVPVAVCSVEIFSLSMKRILPREFDIAVYGYASGQIRFDERAIGKRRLRKIARSYDTKFRAGKVDIVKAIGRSKHDK